MSEPDSEPEDNTKDPKPKPRQTKRCLVCSRKYPNSIGLCGICRFDLKKIIRNRDNEPKPNQPPRACQVVQMGANQ